MPKIFTECFLFINFNFIFYGLFYFNAVFTSLIAAPVFSLSVFVIEFLVCLGPFVSPCCACHPGVIDHHLASNLYIKDKLSPCFSVGPHRLVRDCFCTSLVLFSLLHIVSLTKFISRCMLLASCHVCSFYVRFFVHVLFLVSSLVISPPPGTYL